MKTGCSYLIRVLCVTSVALCWALPASATARGGSDYGASPLQTCGTTGPLNGVDATCYVGSGGFPNDFLFNFTLPNPSASISVTSFTVNFASTAPTAFGLVVGPCPNSNPVPCAANYTTTSLPPFTVTGTLGTGSEVFDFTGFTGNQSGQVTVFFDYAATSPEPTITNITTTTATPEPSTVFLSMMGLALVLGALKIRAGQRIL